MPLYPHGSLRLPWGGKSVNFISLLFPSPFFPRSLLRRGSTFTRFAAARTEETRRKLQSAEARRARQDRQKSKKRPPFMMSALKSGLSNRGGCISLFRNLLPFVTSGRGDFADTTHGSPKIPRESLDAEVEDGEIDHQGYIVRIIPSWQQMLSISAVIILCDAK